MSGPDWPVHFRFCGVAPLRRAAGKVSRASLIINSARVLRRKHWTSVRTGALLSSTR